MSRNSYEKLTKATSSAPNLKPELSSGTLVLTPSFRKLRCSPPKKRTVKPGDAFENTAFEQWFENVRGCRKAGLHLFVKQIPPTDSWHQVDSDRRNFHPLMPALTLVSLLEGYLVLESAMPGGDIRILPSAHL